MMMKEIPVRDAVGHVLIHDITRIVPGESADRAFKKGHIIQENDIPTLLDLGKDNIYVLDLEEGYVHENEAARRIARAVSGNGIRMSEPSEGKVTMKAISRGLLKVNIDALYRINEIDEMALATLHGNRCVEVEAKVAGTRIIPLFTEEERILKVEKIARENYPVLEIKPFRSIRVGLITTGNEVYHGRIEDKFGPVVIDKFENLGSSVMKQILVLDNIPMTVAAIHELINEGAEMVVATGGMSVDPDDRTPASIRAAGANVVTYGSPTFPGAMFMLGYIGEVPVIGIPGCAMYKKTTVFDLIVPRILAGDKVTRQDLIKLGHGGLCSACPECHHPNCAFGT
ncbi:MAG: molybdopterin-binding protein [Geobacteraceae bacterium]